MSKNLKEKLRVLSSELEELFFVEKIKAGERKEELRMLDYELVVRLNRLALILFPDKKGDKHELLSEYGLKMLVRDVNSLEGDIYDKAVLLLRRITVDHVFASANRRTALLASIFFLKSNGITVFIKDNPRNSEVLLGIRNVPSYYTNEEIKDWFKTGEIKQYVRPYPKPKNKGTTRRR